MVRIISLLVGATLLVPVASLACGGGSVMSATKSDGTKVGLIISSQQIHASPSWNPEMGGASFACLGGVQAGEGVVNIPVQPL